MSATASSGWARSGTSSRASPSSIVGGLFGWAAITYDAEKAGGLDDALRTVNDAPFGSVLLTLMALGLICFGVYCFFWARHPKVSTAEAAPRGTETRSVPVGRGGRLPAVG